MPISTLDGLPYLQMVPVDAVHCTNCVNLVATCESCKHAHNLSLLDPLNENLMSAQKALLLDHFRLGHIGIDHLRTLYRCSTETGENCTSCLVPKHANVTTCSVPLCLACRVAKARKSSTNMTTTTINTDRQHILTRNILRPGEQIFVDQYESNVRGRLPNSRGSTTMEQKYCGGTLFFDAASQLIQIFHQSSLGSSDTLASKNKFEKEAAHCGIQVDAYHTDNGIFTKAQF